jgi:wee1-like protein kinase
LGEGSFGTVYQVLSKLDGCIYACKVARRPAQGTADLNRMLREVYALAALSDTADPAIFHIVRYHQAWMEQDRLYIQTELCTGTLGQEIQRNQLSEVRRFKLLREVLLALAFIHRHGMVHLDIKPENIFVKNDQYKLGDFGLVAKVFDKDVEEGDARYMSMELLSGNHDSDWTKSDIFSLGATLYEICLGQALPMNGATWQNLRSGQLSAAALQPPTTSVDLGTLITRMMHPDSTQRPAAAELLRHASLLSDEQKVLASVQQRAFQAPSEWKKAEPPIVRRGLARANTWSGATSLSSYL